MSADFRIEWDASEAELKVWQDGQLVSPYSQFARCEGVGFSLVCDELPACCAAEANGPYAVEFHGGTLTSMALEAAFADDPACERFFAGKPPVEMSWRAGLCQRLTGHGGLVTLACHRGDAATGGQLPWPSALPSPGQRIPLLGGAVDLLLSEEGIARCDVAFMAGLAGCEALARSVRADLPVVAVISDAHELRIAGRFGPVLAFQCPPDDELVFLEMVVAEFHLWKRLVAAQATLEAGASGLDRQDRARISMITRHEPYLELGLPARVALGSSPKLHFFKLPEDTPCEIRTEAPQVAGIASDLTLVPLAEGNVTIRAFPRGRPFSSVVAKTSVYRYVCVTSIDLVAQPSRLRVGECFSVSCTLRPTGAHNAGDQHWSVSPPGAATELTRGRYRTEQPGSCRIELRVGKVKRSVTVDVRARPSSVRLDRHDVSLRLGDNTQRVDFSVLPAGSLGGQVEYRVSDTTVFNVEAATGRILTRGEGNATLEVLLKDERGILIDRDACSLTILPVRDVVTPDGALVSLTCCSVGLLIFLSDPLFRWLFAGGIVASAVGFYLTRRTRMSLSVCIVAIVLALLLTAGATSAGIP